MAEIKLIKVWKNGQDGFIVRVNGEEIGFVYKRFGAWHVLGSLWGYRTRKQAIKQILENTEKTNV